MAFPAAHHFDVGSLPMEDDAPAAPVSNAPEPAHHGFALPSMSGDDVTMEDAAASSSASHAPEPAHQGFESASLWGDGSAMEDDAASVPASFAHQSVPHGFGPTGPAGDDNAMEDDPASAAPRRDAEAAATHRPRQSASRKRRADHDEAYPAEEANPHAAMAPRAEIFGTVQTQLPFAAVPHPWQHVPLSPAPAAVPAIQTRRYRQAHLGVRQSNRAGAVRRATIAASGEAAPRRVADAEMVVAELHDRAHGTAASANSASQGAFKKVYRESAMALRDDAGGSGLDEMVSTSVTAGLRTQLAQIPGVDVDGAIGRLSQERMPTHQLTWPTQQHAVAAAAGGPNHVLAGHPGAVSTVQTDMRRGITTEHGERNALRAQAVRAQLDFDLPGVAATAGGAAAAPAGPPHPAIAPAVQHLAENASVVAAAHTVRHLMAPAPMLSIVTGAGARDSYSAKHGPLIENNLRQRGFASMVAENHNAREALKIQTAARLRNLGHAGLVHPDMNDHLDRHGGDADAAINAMSSPAYAAPPARATLHESFPPPDLQTLHDIAAHNASHPAAADQKHLIGPPRDWIRRS